MSSPTLKMLLLGEDRSASKALKGVGDQAEQTGHHLHGFGEVAKGAFAAFAGIEAVKGSVDFLKEAAKAATEDQESTDRLAQALKNNAGATKAQDAAVEGWISKMELAKGVADDDLRGGLQRLVQSTHSVSESQKLMGVAMDAAAGTGKSVTVVAAAMARAHDGNVQALGRLGIATKDANGHTLTFNQTVAKMAATFKGQANKAAESNAGQMKRLKLTFDEFREGIGYKLLPILTKLGAWFLDKGIPALQKMGSELATKLAPAFKTGTKVANDLFSSFKKLVSWAEANQAWLEPIATGVLAMVAAYKVWTTVSKAWMAVTKAMAAVQLALNVAMEANPIGLVVLALVGLGAALVVAYKKSETFRDIVNGAFNAVSSAASAAWDVIKGVFKIWVDVWFSVIGAMVNGAAKAFGWIPGLGPKLKEAAAAFNSFRDEVNNTLNGIHDKTVHIKVVAQGSMQLGDGAPTRGPRHMGGASSHVTQHASGGHSMLGRMALGARTAPAGTAALHGSSDGGAAHSARLIARAIVDEFQKAGLGGGDNVVIQLDGKTIDASVAKTHRKQGKKK